MKIIKISMLLIVLWLLISCSAPTATPATITETYTAQVQASATAESTSTDTPKPTPTRYPTPEVKRYIGVLLGLDYDPLRIDRGIHGVLTDVFIIYVVQDNHPTGITDIILFTVSRDLFGFVPCSPAYDGTDYEGRDRINAAYAYGGFDCVRDTVKANFDLEVNAPIGVIDMASFTSLVNKLGGVDILASGDYAERCGTLVNDEIIEYEWKEDEWYEMDGVEALCYVRGRTTPLGDLDRNDKMTDMVRGLYIKAWQSLETLDIDGLLAFYDVYKGYVFTDMGLSDMELFIKLVTDGGVNYWHRFTLSTDEVEFFKTPTGASVLMPKVDLADWLRESLEKTR